MNVFISLLYTTIRSRSTSFPIHSNLHMVGTHIRIRDGDGGGVPILHRIHRSPRMGIHIPIEQRRLREGKR